MHVLPIMTSHLPLYLCYRDILSAIKLHTYSIQTPSKIQSSVTKPLQCQCYPGIAIGDKDSCKSHSKLIKLCTSLSSHAYQWLQLRMRMTALYINNNNYEPHLFLLNNRNWARTSWFHVEINCHHTIFAWNIASRSNK